MIRRAFSDIRPRPVWPTLIPSDPHTLGFVAVVRDREVRERTLQEMSHLLKTCEDTLRSDALNTDALFTKAVLFEHAGDHLRALLQLNMVTDINPAYPGVWRTKASVYRRMGKAALAEICSRLGETHE